MLGETILQIMFANETIGPDSSSEDKLEYYLTMCFGYVVSRAQQPCCAHTHIPTRGSRPLGAHMPRNLDTDSMLKYVAATHPYQLAITLYTPAMHAHARAQIAICIMYVSVSSEPHSGKEHALHRSQHAAILFLGLFELKAASILLVRS